MAAVSSKGAHIPICVLSPPPDVVADSEKLWYTLLWYTPPFFGPAAGGKFCGSVGVSLTKTTAKTRFQYAEIAVSIVINIIL